MKSMFLVYEVIFLLMAAFAFGIGLRGLIKKRPLIFSARWLFGFMVLGLAPQLLNPLFFWSGSSGSVGSTDLMLIMISPLMFVFLIIVFWLQMRGYFVFGVTDASFRSSLQAALNKLGLSYEERLSAIHVPSEGFDLQVSVQSWMGTAQIKAKQAIGRPRLKELSVQMAHGFETSQGETNITTFVIYVVLGLFMLATTGAMSMFIHRL